MAVMACFNVRTDFTETHQGTMQHCLPCKASFIVLENVSFGRKVIIPSCKLLIALFVSTR
jgi:hypothetical protein